jgi:hypothetical protein
VINVDGHRRDEPVHVFSVAKVDFHAQGLLGQHLLVAPQTQTVIVRLGTRPGGIYWPAWMSELAGLNP